ncbi:formylglycine-generating enzyme family protein [Treponema sp. UBA7570]|uniref:formylglycine-generating enzyme family protein n=1 Tax=Treponema sp. UBA7570 TaxID=1947749 RepID=UPI0025FEA469|nr:SUMF1/EgtB/PvdO family nonheme iron enzyme [Treponema sp. UBA7570]
MKLKKLFLILAALLTFSSALTSASDYEYLLGKYKYMAEWLAAHPEEKSIWGAAERAGKEKREADMYAQLFDANLAVIPGKDFLMMKTEVTQKQWQTVMESNPSYFKGDDLPVENVSWIDAVVFCNKLSEKVGLKPCYSYNGISSVEKWEFLKENLREWSYSKWENFSKNFACDKAANGYRLPTVEEWQYAAKGGENYEYSGSDNLDEVGWYDGNSGSKTHPVAQKKPNGYGLYDMSGNMREWCWDSHGNESRYYCGGCWYRSANYCEVDDKYWNSASGVYGNVGFRIVRSSSKK